jgi:hypothetical protein
VTKGQHHLIPLDLDKNNQSLLVVVSEESWDIAPTMFLSAVVEQL